MILHPDVAKLEATALPIPRPAPVIMAIFPVRALTGYEDQ
jgi:hypothetical protein